MIRCFIDKMLQILKDERENLFLAEAEDRETRRSQALSQVVILGTLMIRNLINTTFSRMDPNSGILFCRLN